MPKTKTTAKKGATKKKKPADKEIAHADDTLKEMVSSLNELPTEVLEQLLKNLDAIEKYNKEHPEEIYGDDEGNEDK